VDFPGSSVVKNPPANTGDMGLIPGSGRSTGEGNGNLLQHFCLGNPMDSKTERDTVHGGAKDVSIGFLAHLNDLTVTLLVL